MMNYILYFDMFLEIKLIVLNFDADIFIIVKAWACIDNTYFYQIPGYFLVILQRALTGCFGTINGCIKSDKKFYWCENTSQNFGLIINNGLSGIQIVERIKFCLYCWLLSSLKVPKGRRST